MPTQDQAALERQRHQNKLELEREKQRTALITADAKKKAKKANAPSVLQRETIGRASSNTKMVGDSVTVAGVGGVTALWIATRPNGGQAYAWAGGIAALGVIAMVESRPGTVLESGAAGALGASVGVGLLKLFNLAK